MLLFCFSLHIQDRDGNYLSLVFESIEKAHKGNYTCRGFINHKEHLLTFNLIVVSKSILKSIQLSFSKFIGLEF